MSDSIDVHGLPAKWRQEADDDLDSVTSWKLARRRCADELEAALRQSGEADRRDAERYRRLRKNAHSGTIFAAGLPGRYEALSCDEPESEWDAAIDAAVQGVQS